MGENPLTRMPSSSPSSKPTNLPTPRPTSFFDNQPSKQDPGTVPTPTPTVAQKDVELKNDITSLGNNTETMNLGSTATDEYQCTGEPCPVDTHCRSRYGSCGPGFIYCNTYSIWKAEWNCPIFAPGTRPTKTPTPPTPRPTSFFDRNKNEEDFTSSSGSTPSRNDPKQPSLPTLAKPTLPTITKPKPFNVSSSFFWSNEDDMIDKVESESKGHDTSDEDRSDKQQIKDGGRSDEEEKKQNSWSSSQPGSYLQNEEYQPTGNEIESWNGWGDFGYSGSPNVCYCTISLCTFIAFMCTGLLYYQY